MLVARAQFVAEIDGKNVVVLPGARFPASSAVAKARPEMFEAAIEQTTAAPGEKRKR